MNKQPLLYCLLVLCILSVVQPSYAFGSPKKIPSPKWLDITGIAKSMLINGLPSKVYYFEAYRNAEDLLKFYRQKWSDRGPRKSGYREAHVAPWNVISRLEGKFLYTVQVQQDEDLHIRGYLAVADLAGIRRQQTRSIPRMSGSQIINDVSSSDPGSRGRTLLLVNKFSIPSNTAYYRQYYTARGWNLIMDKSGEKGSVLSFRQHNRQAHLVLSNSGKTTKIVMTLMENG
ncbi:hypothetical protein [Desulfomarina sp.]